MLKASHHCLIYPFFRQYTLLLMKRNFHSVNIIRTNSFSSENLPLLMIANHISWWDGFWAMYLNLNLFHKTFYFMMLEEQLLKYRYFQLSGGFSIKKKSREMIESLTYASKILEDPKNMLLIFPEGELRSLYNSSHVFEKGFERILKGHQDNFQLVFVANFIDYLSHKKPDLYMYVSEYQGKNFLCPDIEKAYNNFYSECLDIQKFKKE